jgi:type VI secretion system protein ImpE
MSNPSERFDAGDLSGATDATLRLVKAHPTDTGKRAFLCELFCFAGDWDRADKQLELITKQDPETMVGAGLIRQLIRAATARQEFYQQGHLPEFVGEVPPLLQQHLKASVALRDRDVSQAAHLLAEAEQQRTPTSGRCNGKPFDDWRDLDDLCAPFFEIFTTNGKYYWIPIDQVQVIEFRAPQHARDLLWRSAHLTFADGADAEVFLPALYVDSPASSSDRLRLGRMTEWREEGDGITRGIGQRMFLAGDEAQAIMELERLEFMPTPAGT